MDVRRQLAVSTYSGPSSCFPHFNKCQLHSSSCLGQNILRSSMALFLSYPTLIYHQIPLIVLSKYILNLTALTKSTMFISL